MPGPGGGRLLQVSAARGSAPRGACSPGGGEVSHHALRQTPTRRDGYCCGRYASYWNAFLLYIVIPWDAWESDVSFKFTHGVKAHSQWAKAKKIEDETTKMKMEKKSSFRRISGGSRISPRRGRQLSRGAPTYDFAKFSQKLHEIERIWAPRGARGTRTPPFRSTTENRSVHFHVDPFISDSKEKKHPFDILILKIGILHFLTSRARLIWTRLIRIST